MTMMLTRLLQFWQKAAADLGLQLIAPFSLLLTSGKKLDAIFLIKNFGATNGMLIFGNYDEIFPYVDEIVEAGYGFSILDEPMANENYSKDEYIALLADWGWSGDVELKPEWL